MTPLSGLDAPPPGGPVELRPTPFWRLLPVWRTLRHGAAAALGLGLVWIGAQTLLDERRLAASGALARGQVEFLLDAPLSRRVLYGFRGADGRAWRGRTLVDAPTLRALREDEIVTIRYWPPDPRVSRLEGQGGPAETRGWFLLILGLPPLGGAAAGLAPILARAARLRRLARVGRLTEADVLGLRRDADEVRVRLRYAFAGPDGRRREGVGEPVAEAEVARLRATHVLVDPEDADNHCLARDALRLAR